MRIAGSVLLILALVLAGMMVGPVSANINFTYQRVPTMDGWIRYEAGGTAAQSWIQMVQGTTGGGVHNGEATLQIHTRTNATGLFFEYLSRGIIVFDTSQILSNYVITNANITLDQYSSQNAGLGNGLKIEFVSGTPKSFYAVTTGDHNRNGTTVLSDSVSLANWAVNTNHTFELNPAGLAAFNKSSAGEARRTAFYIMLDWDQTSTYGGGSAASTYGGFRFYGNASGATQPMMIVQGYIPSVAEFSGTPTYGIAPHTVTFTDASTNSPTSWIWNFGDGTTSTSQNPTHTYQAPGNYTVSLSVDSGTDTETKTDYIKVATAPVSCPINLAAMYNVTGNGTDESAALQQAFGYADTQASCKVTFPTGDKTILFSLPLHIGDNIELDGQNATLKIPDGFSNTSYSSGNIISTGNHDWWHNLNYNGNYPGGATEPINQNILINDWVLIEGSSFRNVSHYNVYSYKTSNWIFRNNHIENVTQYGITTGGGSVDPDFSNNVTVTGNTIIGARQVGIKIRGTTNGTISYNKVYNLQSASPTDSYAYGIRFYTQDEDDYDVNVTGNIIDGFGKGSYYSGIGFDTTANICQNCVAHNNTVNGTSYGIVPGSSQPNTVISNTVRNSSRTSLFVGGEGHTVTSNIFDDGVLIGIPPGGSSAYNITLRNNIITDGIAYTEPMTGSGVGLVRGSKNAVIDFNRIIVSGTGIGVNINAASGIVNFTQITNNVITTATGDCYSDAGDGTTYYNNTCNGASPGPVINFAGVQTKLPGQVSTSFTDNSALLPLTWEWRAKNVTGNNTDTIFSVVQNPTSIFNHGNYSISLWASNASGYNLSDQVYFVNVSVEEGPIIPSFTMSRNQIIIPQPLYVNDTSRIPALTTRRNWSWGDGTANSTTLSATHYYTVGPRYAIINLEVCNSNGCNSTRRTVFIRRG